MVRLVADSHYLRERQPSGAFDISGQLACQGKGSGTLFRTVRKLWLTLGRLVESSSDARAHKYRRSARIARWMIPAIHRTRSVADGTWYPQSNLHVVFMGMASTYLAEVITVLLSVLSCPLGQCPHPITSETQSRSRLYAGS